MMSRMDDEANTVWIITYFGDRVSADGECVVPVTARTGCGWVTFTVCVELLYIKWFTLIL